MGRLLLVKKKEGRIGVFVDWAESRKGIGKRVPNFWKLKWMDSNGIRI
jgi:hypothetical protein